MRERLDAAFRGTRMVTGALLAMALAVPPACGGDRAEPIDLSGFGRIESDVDPMPDGGSPRVEPLPVAAVMGGLDSPASRFYVSGIVGASFATVSTGGVSDFGGAGIRQVGSVNETIFTGGGALGMAFARPTGLLRMEIEGRARGPMIGQSSLVGNGDVLPLDVTATNGWSTLTNFWRDYFLSDALGIYAGGGFGVGGYQYTLADTVGAQLTGSTSVTTFAWQVGTGVVWRLSDRVTIDTGYRFFAMSPDSTTLFIDGAPVAPMLGIGTFSSAFSASELLLSIRIYEPFRPWR